MYKKLLLIILMFISLFSLSFSATSVITQCPASLNNNTEYVIASNFNVNQDPCFDMTSGSYNNITFNGNNSHLTLSSGGAIFEIGHITNDVNVHNITIEDFEIDANAQLIDFIYFKNSLNGYIADFLISDNEIINIDGNYAMIKFFDVEVGGVAGKNRYFNGTFEIEGNYYEGKCPMMMNGRPNSISNDLWLHFENLIFTSNDILSRRDCVISNAEASFWVNRIGTTPDSRIYIDYNMTIVSNNFAGDGGNGGTIFDGINLYLAGASDYTWSDNFDGSLDQSNDRDFNGLTDNFILRQSGDTVTYSNGIEKTESDANSGAGNRRKEAYFTTPFSLPSTWTENRVYVLTHPITLNSTDYINLNNRNFITIDLRLFRSATQDAITVNSNNVMRMHNNNKIIGDENYGADIITSGSINVAYNSSLPYTSLWGIINYYDDLTIENINFTLNAVGNYGLIQASGSSFGDYLKFNNNHINYNFVASNDLTPVIHINNFGEITNNIFDIGMSTNRTFFGSGADGGHLFQDNIFIDCGYAFQDLVTVSANYVSIANHNTFNYTGVNVCNPFDTSSQAPASTNLTFNLNGDYVYTSVCDAYTFNIGNYYEDWTPLFCNDTNADDICDDAVLRSVAGTNIKDFKPIEFYKHDFGSHTSTIIPDDLCGSFVWNVITPVNNSNYNLSGGANLTINWEFISTAYPTMDCFTYLNDDIQIDLSVTSGENIQYNYALATGEYNFRVICENDFITKNSGIFYFQVNNGTGFVSPPSPTTPAVLGCTDSGATNYNPLATVDDGSCTYAGGGGNQTSTTSAIDLTNTLGGGLTDMYSSDPDTASKGVIKFFSFLQEPITWLLLLGIILLIMAIVFIIIAILGIFIK